LPVNLILILAVVCGLRSVAEDTTSFKATEKESLAVREVLKSLEDLDAKPGDTGKIEAVIKANTRDATREIQDLGPDRRPEKENHAD